MNRKTEIQVGATVLLALALLLWGIAWLSALARARVQQVWHVRFTQAGGVGDGGEVQVNGLRKGVVKSVRLQGDHVIMDLAIARDVVLTRDCRVGIRSVNALGDRAVVVDYSVTGEPWTARDTIPGIFEKGLPEVMGDVARATSSIAAVGEQLDRLAQHLGSENGVARTVDSFQRTSEALEQAVAENRAALRATMENFSATSTTARTLVVDRQEELSKALDHFTSAAENLDRLSTRLDSLRSSLQSVATRLDRGDGTLGKLVSEEKLYTDLAGSVRDLRLLIADIKANPRKYFKVSVF